MINLKKILNSKIVALTAAAGITPLISQSALAESTKTRANSEAFKNRILIAQEAVTTPGDVPTTTPGNVPTTDTGNIDRSEPGGVEAPSSPDGVQINAPGPTISPPTNDIDTRDYNAPGDQLDNDPSINTPGDRLDDDATINSPGDQINNDDGFTNSPGDQIENDADFIGVPAR